MEVKGAAVAGGAVEVKGAAGGYGDWGEGVFGCDEREGENYFLLYVGPT